MKKKQDIPSHRYSEAAENVQQTDGEPLLSLDPNFPFVLTKFELMNELGQADYPHRHDYYELLFLSEGAGTHVIDFTPYLVKPPVFHFLSKGQVHFWQLDKPLKGYALLFPEEFLGAPTSNIIRTHDLSFFNNVGQAPYLSVDQDMELFGSLIQGIEQEYLDENKRSLSILRSYLHILLSNLNRLYTSLHPDEQSQSSSLVRQFKQLVTEHFLTDHSAQDYADKLGVSDSHLRNMVKSVTGVAPGNLIREHLVLEAKRMLAHSNETVAEIGYSLNFEDSSYFGRFFKRETGLSPVAFRQQIRSQYNIDPE
jgi:AraC-like DNA-binding protein/quercetin dioxygenase-like cupin family protein